MSTSKFNAKQIITITVALIAIIALVLFLINKFQDIGEEVVKESKSVGIDDFEACLPNKIEPTSRICEAISLKNDDYCNIYEANSKDYTLCMNDIYIMRPFIENNISYCDEIKSEELKIFCKVMMDDEECQVFDDDELTQICLANKNNCEDNSFDSRILDQCWKINALWDNRSEYCDNIEAIKPLSQCVAWASSDPAACSDFSNVDKLILENKNCFDKFSPERLNEECSNLKINDTVMHNLLVNAKICK